MAIPNTDHEPSTFFHASFDSVYLARVLKLTSLENSLHIKINSQSNRRHASQVQFASNSFSPKQFFYNILGFINLVLNMSDPLSNSMSATLSTSLSATMSSSMSVNFFCQPPCRLPCPCSCQPSYAPPCRPPCQPPCQPPQCHLDAL